MARTPVRFAGPAQLTTSAATQYTVPEGFSAILRAMRYSNPTDVDVGVTVSIGADAAGTRIVDQFTVTANAIVLHWCYEVLVEDEIIQAKASLASSVVLTLNGDLIASDVG